MNAALDRIEQERQGRAYLVGDAFTVADLTAAALLGALLQPPEIQYPLRVDLPPYLQDYRATLLQHPATQWAAGIYRLHRGRSAEVLAATGCRVKASATVDRGCATDPRSVCSTPTSIPSRR